MKVGFFTPHIKWPPHYETELELIQEHLDSGDEVVQFVCNAELPACDINIQHNIQSCLSCISCREFGKTLIEGPYIQRSFMNLTAKDKEEIKAVHDLEFANVKELQKLTIENFDIGYAVASSLISKLRDPSPDLKAHRQVLKAYLVSSLGIYRSMLNYLNDLSFDRVYTFNGRLAHVKPVLRACQALKVDCYIHERGNSKDHYALYENTIPHDIKYVEGLIREAWNQASEEEREKGGEAFYKDRVKGVEGSWYSFTKDQVKGLLPEGWDSTKQNIVIFNSSEDEFASIGDEWSNPVYDTQLGGIKKIIRDMEHDNNTHIYLRIHPNLKKVENRDKKELYKLSGKNFTLIPAESPVSTYDLINAATKIFSFGSTAGIEAVFWGKPSILAGKNYYYTLGATYNAASHEEVIRLLQSPLEPKSIEPALKYGYYLKTFGISFKHYKGEGVVRGKFKGERVLGVKTTKHSFINWILYKPIIRNFRKQIGALHSRYLIKFKYL